MTFRISLCAGLTCLLASGAARAQSLSAAPGTDVAIGYQGLPAKAPGATSGGVQLSESALLHVGVGAEVGYDSNVFYNDTQTKSSVIARVVPFLELTNSARNGAVSSDVFYDLGASLTYREYLSNDAEIKAQRAFNPSVFGTLDFGRVQNVGFGVAETFSRTEDPPYVRGSEPITRDVNMATASVRWAPGGGRLSGVLRYMNTLDAFETGSLKQANSMAHLLTLDTSWKWLPKTALVLQISQGYTSYFNAQADGVKKPTSYPLHVLAGLRGLITAKLSVAVLVGYANNFYQLAPGHSGQSGLASVSAGVDVTYHPTVLTSLALGYRRDVLNAIIGDFYYLDSVYVNFGQAIAGRLGLGISARYESRSFQNIPLVTDPANPMPTLQLINRHDNYFQAGANLDYHMRDWTYAGVAYTVATNSSDASDNRDFSRINYVKQLFFARIGITY